MLLSIVIAAYNAEKHIGDLLESIVCQAPDCVEVIVVDNSSTDKTKAICQTYVEKYEKIELCSESNRGVSAARNRGISVARGKFIVFADADDTFRHGGISDMINLVDLEKADVYVFNALINTNRGQMLYNSKAASTGRVTGKEAARIMLYSKGIGNPVWAKLYRKSVIKGVLFNEAVGIAEDLLFNYHVFLKAKRVIQSNLAVYNYNVHTGSAMAISSPESRFDGVLVTDMICDSAATNGLYMPAIAKSLEEALAVASMLDRDGKNDSLIFAQCILVLKKHRKKVFFDKGARPKTRIYALGSMINPCGFIKLLNITKKVYSVITGVR